ncbi:hypothetical protein SEUCBS139899_003585 [Sporothrix eucalyptigena]|uniref:lytic cellulose monooxygenase (C4-dehydrogenating) n=1 Tax=Sporothrix eucalyptigena TaxID=1812306 RepID=A0ABP0C893_9PEZI
MRLPATIAAVAASVSMANAHCYIWGVFVNGVDQGTFRAIRTPAYNGPSPHGYANSPVKNLTSIDLRCNVLGDKQADYTIQVRPGDNLTFDWHHDKRTDTDDVIASSHHGPALVYLSPDPPTEDSFVKIWEEGLYELSDVPFGAGKWATTSDIAANHGHMNVRVPAGLKPGYYLVRAEMIALHEGDASYLKNSFRGAQFYPNCVQIEVVGDGTVELPKGVSFPGAYDYSDPGVVFDIYCSTKTSPLPTTPCATTYQIPGPTVWSGAWPTTPSVDVGPISGATTATLWSSWIEKSVVTYATYDGSEANVLSTSLYTADWSTAYHTPEAMATPTA